MAAPPPAAPSSTDRICGRASRRASSPCSIMLDACIDAPADFEGWRRLARAALQAGIPPEEVAWRAAGSPPDLQVSRVLRGHGGATVRVPPEFVDLARQVICHRSGQRFALLYRLLWRIAEGERALLEICTDPDVRRASRMAQ